MATLSLNIRPFEVPDRVTIELPPQPKQAGMQPLPTIELKDLSDEVLAILIDEFAANVMAKAGRTG